jgi:hypothetical protein
MAKEQLTAYCLKTKTKDTPFSGKPEISKTSRGGYIAKGVDKDGNKMSAMLGEAKALQAIKDGVATQAF